MVKVAVQTSDGAVSDATPSQTGEMRDVKKGDFLRLMLMGPKSWSAALRPLRGSSRTTGNFLPLPHAIATGDDVLRLPLATSVGPVDLESPAIDVMTDLRRIDAITVDQTAQADEAHAAMIARGVRALFVVDNARYLLGIVTATDILGERPVKFAQERGLRHRDVLVRDIMTPRDRLEILDLREVQRARVGDVVATLKRAGRQHAIAVEAFPRAEPAETWIRGIFSLTQIARQLGVWPHAAHDLARTFAEIEEIIGP